MSLHCIPRALLAHSLRLRPVYELMDHPSVKESIAKRANFTADGKTKLKDKEKIAARSRSMTRSLARKRRLLENYLRWFFTKSEALGTALDHAAASRVKSEHELRGMGGYVSDWVQRVRRDSLAAGVDLDSVKGGGVGRGLDMIGRDYPSAGSGGLRGAAADRSDQIGASREEAAAETMFSYVVAYRQAAARFDSQCKAKCKAEGTVLLKRGVMYGEFHIDEESRGEAPFGLSGDKVSKDVSDAKFTLRRSRDRCEAACEEAKQTSTRTAKQIGVMERREQRDPEDVVGDATFELSTDAFFAGVDGACTICSGLVRTVASGTLPTMGGGYAEPRDICRNRLFAATSADLSNPMSSDYDLDAELNEDNTLSGADDFADIGAGGAAAQQKTARMIKSHGSTICLGIVAELEDRMRTALTEHGFAMPHRARLVDIIRTWRSHSKQVGPKHLANSVCRRFVHCSPDELPDEEGTSKQQQEAVAHKAAAEATLAKLNDQIAKIDANVKKLPKAGQKPLADKAEIVSLGCGCWSMLFVRHISLLCVHISGNISPFPPAWAGSSNTQLCLHHVAAKKGGQSRQGRRRNGRDGGEVCNRAAEDHGGGRKRHGQFLLLRLPGRHHVGQGVREDSQKRVVCHVTAATTGRSGRRSREPTLRNSDQGEAGEEVQPL